jgi:hypothetical protein
MNSFSWPVVRREAAKYSPPARREAASYSALRPPAAGRPCTYRAALRIEAFCQDSSGYMQCSGANLYGNTYGPSNTIPKTWVILLSDRTEVSGLRERR